MKQLIAEWNLSECSESFTCAAELIIEWMIHEFNQLMEAGYGGTPFSFMNHLNLVYEMEWNKLIQWWNEWFGFKNKWNESAIHLFN